MEDVSEPVGLGIKWARVRDAMGSIHKGQLDEASVRMDKCMSSQCCL
jgi:hypothetical protein